MKVNPGYFVNKLLKYIYPAALRNCLVDKTARVGAGSNCINVQIGRYSYMGEHNSVAYAKIGAFCSIASYCAIGGGSHPLQTVTTSPVLCTGKFGGKTGFSEVKHREVVIGHDVWIGEAVFICEGIKIGTGAVIGAHSVVTRDVPPYAVAAGAPARLLRYRFDEDTIEKLLASKWWEWPDEKLKKADFSSTERFFRSLEEKSL